MIFDLIKSGEIQRIKEWIDAGNDINTTNSDQNSLLGFAILNHQWKIAHFLLDRGASTNSVINKDPENGSNVCLIRKPMQHNCWKLVEQLIRCGADARDYWEQLSPLGYFAQTNNIEMINFILKRNIKLVDFPSNHSPLKLAIIAGHLNIVEALTKAGASLTKEQSLNGNGVSVAYKATPIQFAQHFNHDDIVNYLIKIDPNLSNDLDQPHHLDLSGLDFEDQRSTLTPRLSQAQLESDELRRERAQMCFKDLKGLSSAIIQHVLPAIAIINNQ